MIQWFWKALHSYGQEERAKLLQFVTGTSRVPLDGFKSLRGISGPQKFQIHKSYRKDQLPAAHTWYVGLPLFHSLPAFTMAHLSFTASTSWICPNTKITNDCVKLSRMPFERPRVSALARHRGYRCRVLFSSSFALAVEINSFSFRTNRASSLFFIFGEPMTRR